ncbi:MAG: hypothetical protein CR967_04210 [Proteobacteria bacterium]|nr:MAG: hypothetical protein CR967_04210 [Pseudomonadota bacterium]
MFKRIGYFICFLYSFNLGILTLFAKKVHIREVFVDFSNMGYFPIILGILAVLFLYLALRPKSHIKPYPKPPKQHKVSNKKPKLKPLKSAKQPKRSNPNKKIDLTKKNIKDIKLSN